MKGDSGDKINSVLAYPGAKNFLAQWIIPHFPPHRIYVEPFGGSAGVLLRKKPCYLEVYNDANGELVNFFRVLRDREKAAELIRLLDLTPYSKEEHSSAYAEDACTDVELARRTFVKSFQSFGTRGLFENCGWRRVVKLDECGGPKRWRANIDCIEAACRRLSEVMVENDDAIKVIDRHDSPETLFYLDPPYLGEYSKMYRFGSHEEEWHRKFLDRICTLQGMAVLSGCPNEMYDIALKDWKREERTAGSISHSLKTEVLWINANAERALKSREGEIEKFF